MRGKLDSIHKESKQLVLVPEHARSPIPRIALATTPTKQQQQKKIILNPEGR
jgi:hypothetical protein